MHGYGVVLSGTNHKRYVWLFFFVPRLMNKRLRFYCGFVAFFFSLLIFLLASFQCGKEHILADEDVVQLVKKI